LQKPELDTNNYNIFSFHDFHRSINRVTTKIGSFSSKTEYFFNRKKLLPYKEGMTTETNSNGDTTGYHNHSGDGYFFWNNISVKSPATSTTTTTTAGVYLLQNCSGRVGNGQLCGILGPSGAGKSTLLSALAGILKPTASTSASMSRNHVQVTIEDMGYCPPRRRRSDGDDASTTTMTRGRTESLSITDGTVGLLQQKDVFFSMLTVRETLELAAVLELPHSAEAERTQRVGSILDSLGLTQLQHRLVGDSTGPFRNELSGGEKRRLSLAVELVSSPKLFLGDEPTTGLDSKLSERVVQLIHRLVVKEANVPCILSLHQPRSSIWKMLDSVVLLAPGGRVCYVGPAPSARSYFHRLGYTCDEETNPSEFLIDLVSIDTEDPQQALLDERRVQHLAEAYLDSSSPNPQPTCAWEESATSSSSSSSTTANRKPSMSILLQRFRHLLVRSWRQNIRNHQVNAVRLFVSAGNAYFFTNVFGTMSKHPYGRDDWYNQYYSVKTVPDRTALLSFGVINMAMMTVMKTIDLFGKEKPVVIREQRKRQYTSFEYLVSKSLAEIPLDTVFALLFTTVLKTTSSLRISWTELTLTFCLMTVCGASLGFAIGSWSPSAEVALSVGVPLMVMLLGVGVITPSVIDDDQPQHPPSSSMVVEGLKYISPIAYAIRAVCIAEYDGMVFGNPNEKVGWFRSLFRKVKDFSRMGGLAMAKSGNDILNELGLSDETYQGAMIHLALLSLGFLFLSWIGLMYQNGLGRGIRSN
jgi:ABC-type multidrug transport system ATPase subunit